MPSAAAKGLRSTWLRLALCVALALVGASASFAQSAARIGWYLPGLSFAPPAFYAWQRRLQRLEVAVVRSPSRTQIGALRSVARSGQATEPLAVQAWRALALARQAESNTGGARSIMLAAQRLSRRDSLVQAWLLDDAVRRSDVSAALRHFDLLLRTNSRARPELLARIAKLIGSPHARRDLVPYVRADNEWFADFNLAASRRRGSIMPYARLLLASGTLPGGEFNRTAYAAVIDRMVREGQFDLVGRLYLKLPGSQRELVNRVDLADGEAAYYPPVGGWVLPEDPDWRATLVATGTSADAVAMDISVNPISEGIVARRLVWPPADARSIRWRINGMSGGEDARAQIVVRCLDAVALSDELLKGPTSGGVDLPSACPVAMVEISVNGGTGQEPASMLIEQLSLSSHPMRAGG